MSYYKRRKMCYVGRMGKTIYKKEGEIMYELLIKLKNDLEYKKYTIKDLEEMKKILKDLQTEEVKLKNLNKRK